MVAVEPRRFFMHTYGCQMNVHDSERIAGLLEADGLVVTGTEADADVIVYNTCCIRENADNKLYGNLGHAASVKRARPDVQIMVGGCLAQKDKDAVSQETHLAETEEKSQRMSLLQDAMVDLSDRERRILTEAWAQVSARLKRA